MKIIAPKPFTYRGGNKAVLLLHGFTGNTGDVRRLGRHIQQHGYTCHAPLFNGHGGTPGQLLQTGPEDWWQDVIQGYNALKAEGYRDIAVAGVSMGGVFSLKIATEWPVKGIISMSAPAKEKSIDDLYERVRNYARSYKKMEEKNADQIEAELKELEQAPMPFLKNLQQIIIETSQKLNRITAPIFILQGCLDQDLYKESARWIAQNVSSEKKQIKWYEQSGHLITLGKEREKVYEDIENFLNSLDW
ncbi:MAG TPA: alpha/beta fold hydrolase [Bacillales bacterium]|nr:alpha/beta fold hydrolase [Bacillales bacterium]